MRSSKKLQVQGARERAFESYNAYGEKVSERSNEVGELFWRAKL